METGIESLPGIVDVCALKADVKVKDVERVCSVVRAYGCAGTLVNPCYLSCSIRNTIGLEIDRSVAVSSPLGCDLTSVKVYSAKQSELMGASTVDMVMNVSAFLSGNKKYTFQDINAVCECVKIPVRVIMETSVLNEDETAAAAGLIAKTKAACVVTATGFGDETVTVQTVGIIKSAVGDSLEIKVSGGISGIEEMLELAGAGANRFGLCETRAVELFREIDARLGREPVEIL